MAHIDTNSGCEFIKCDFASTEDRHILDDLSTIIGDAVHNLKCALDYIWLETITRLVPAGDWERTKFPAYPTQDMLECKLRDLQINISAPHFFDFLVTKIKAYRGGDFAIWPVHKLDVGDKHRLLIPVIHYSSISDIYAEDQNGEIHRTDTWGTFKPFPHYLKLERGVHIKNPGSPSFSVVFKDGDGRDFRVLETLRLYSERILAIVETLEAFVEAR